MKARRFICKDVRSIQIEDFEIGEIPADGVLVKNEYTAVSRGTELWMWEHGAEPGRQPSFPRTTGYCNAGVVIEVGSEVRRVRPGDRVAGQGNHASHSILKGLFNKVPEAVSSKSACLLTMAAIAMHGVRVSRVELGEAVAVVGLGLVGQFALSIAKLAGAIPLIAVDLDDTRLEAAARHGADVCLNPRGEPDLVAALRGACVEDGANCVLECTGIPSVYPTAVKLVCTAGRMVAVGSPRGKVEFDFMEDVHLREVAILGAIHPITPTEDNVYFRWTKDRERNLIFRLLAEGRMSAEDLITHEAKPEDCSEIYRMLADNPQEALGVVFQWV